METEQTMGVRIYVGEMGCKIYLSKSENTAVVLGFGVHIHFFFKWWVLIFH